MLDGSPGNQPALADVSSEVEAEPHREPPQSPVVRLSPAAAPVGAQPRTLREVIAAHIGALESHNRDVLETADAEAVHKTRVTTRRLQASIDLLQTEDDPLGMRRLKKRLRRWRRRLSRVRNYDVFVELLDKEFSARSRLHGPHLELLKSRLSVRRARLVEQNRRHFEHVTTRDIESSLVLRRAESVEDSPAQTEATMTTANGPIDLQVEAGSETVVRAVDGLPLDAASIEARGSSRIEQRLAEFLALAAQSHPSRDPRDLHQLRIAAKRLRYLFEIASDLGYGDTSRALVWLRGLQDRIGDWHDLEALESEIIKMVSKHGFMKEHLQECGKMLEAAAVLQKKKEVLIARLFPVKVPVYVTTTSHRLVRKLRPYHPRRRRARKN